MLQVLRSRARLLTQRSGGLTACNLNGMHYIRGISDEKDRNKLRVDSFVGDHSLFHRSTVRLTRH